VISLIAHYRRFSRFWAEFAEPILFEFPVVRIYVKFTQNYKTYHFCPVFAAVRGPVGPGGGTAKSPGRDGTAKRGPFSSFIPTCRATLENIRKQRKTTGDDGGWWGTVGDDTMLSVLVLGSYLSGKFWKRRDGTTKCRPSSSCPRTDGLPRCEHCFCL